MSSSSAGCSSVEKYEDDSDDMDELADEFDDDEPDEKADEIGDDDVDVINDTLLFE